jgi:hypothetical protein
MPTTHLCSGLQTMGGGIIPPVGESSTGIMDVKQIGLILAIIGSVVTILGAVVAVVSLITLLRYRSDTMAVTAAELRADLKQAVQDLAAIVSLVKTSMAEQAAINRNTTETLRMVAEQVRAGVDKQAQLSERIAKVEG